MTHRLSCFSIITIQFVLVLIGLTACSSNGKKWNPEDYTVKSGDTIYSIAWRYEVDPEEFAAWNGVNTSYFIKPGQRLHTRKPYNFDSKRKADSQGVRAGSIAYAPETAGKPIQSATQSAEKWVKVKKGDSLYKLSKQYGVSVKRLTQLNQLKSPYLLQPGQTIFLKPLPSSKPVTTTATRKTPNRNTKTQKPNRNTKTQTPNRNTKTQTPNRNTKTQTPTTVSQSFNWPKSIKWRRPAKGKVVKKFNRQRNDAKGIDIAGKQGDAIVASAAGKVVYSGDGLISYGNLIIIKHNRTYLSAYAYNRKLLVKEGDVVKSGQKIAEMGRKDKASTRLHFEIRKNGKPVDPLKYLPWK